MSNNLFSLCKLGRFSTTEKNIYSNETVWLTNVNVYIYFLRSFIESASRLLSKKNIKVDKDVRVQGPVP